MVDFIDVLKEFKEGFLPVGPDHEYVVLEPGIPKMLDGYPGVNVFGFKFTHEGVGVRAGALAAHCAALDLDEVLIIKSEIIRI